jgi:hypothetical protein
MRALLNCIPDSAESLLLTLPYPSAIDASDAHPFSSEVGTLIFGWIMWPLETLGVDNLLENLESSSSSAMAFSQSFRKPKGFGPGRYDGCHVLVSKSSKRVFDKLIGTGSPVTIVGFQGVYLERDVGEERWGFTCTMLDDDILVVATEPVMLDALAASYCARKPMSNESCTVPEFEHLAEVPSWIALHRSVNASRSEGGASEFAEWKEHLDDGAFRTAMLAKCLPGLDEEVIVEYILPTQPGLQRALSAWKGCPIREAVDQKSSVVCRFVLEVHSKSQLQAFVTRLSSLLGYGLWL